MFVLHLDFHTSGSTARSITARRRALHGLFSPTLSSERRYVFSPGNFHAALLGRWAQTLRKERLTGRVYYSYFTLRRDRLKHYPTGFPSLKNAFHNAVCSIAAAAARYKHHEKVIVNFGLLSCLAYNPFPLFSPATQRDHSGQLESSNMPDSTPVSGELSRATPEVQKYRPRACQSCARSKMRCVWLSEPGATPCQR